jgi:hypothetical protein
MKYIYWGYAAEGFEETEELYHLSRDPLELANVADNPEYGSVREQMREAYDRHLARWKAEAVPYNNYRSYGIAFDRKKLWTEKEALFPQFGPTE